MSKTKTFATNSEIIKKLESLSKRTLAGTSLIVRTAISLLHKKSDEELKEVIHDQKVSEYTEKKITSIQKEDREAELEERAEEYGVSVPEYQEHFEDI